MATSKSKQKRTKIQNRRNKKIRKQKIKAKLMAQKTAPPGKAVKEKASKSE